MLIGTQIYFDVLREKYLRLNNLLSTKRLSKQIARLLLAAEKTPVVQAENMAYYMAPDVSNICLVI